MLNDTRFHEFLPDEIKGIELPCQFTFPFYYAPHPLCIMASNHLKSYLTSRKDWDEELQNGKMMGVLVVKKDGKMGFLAAFSGNLSHSNNHEYFVPAVYDLLSQTSFFPHEETQISQINQQIQQEESSPYRKSLALQYSESQENAHKEIESFKLKMKEAKLQRDMLRKNGIDESELIAESQFQKAELKRIRTRWQQQLDSIQLQLKESDEKIVRWKIERKQRSQALQEKIFRNFIMLNAHGEGRDLCDIFMSTTRELPPAGAGECAAPKLLQYAYIHGYKPMAMAEFWVGRSPKDEIRHDGCFYPACKAKCEPILMWMLQGLNVEPNPLKTNKEESPLVVLYDDEWIVAVDKPDGVLSVPGKINDSSIYEQVKALYPNDDICVVHRLDMATSGVLLFGKSAQIHKQLQALFESRQVKKHYIAVLDAIVVEQSGKIELPIILNPNDRPRQMVSYDNGKQAITHYQVIKQEQGLTYISFYPETGRTHQLRVHASHPQGLNAPIVGDSLYGKHSDRLYLHAYSIEFIHPVTNTIIKITSPCSFYDCKK